MKTKLVVLVLLVASCALAQPRFFVGGGYGPHGGGYVAFSTPPPPPAYVAYRPPCPGPGYSWVGGYYYPYSGRYTWRAGYWARPPYPRAYWVAPRYHHGRYYYGHWRR